MPVTFDTRESIQRVADYLKLPKVNGESDGDLRKRVARANYPSDQIQAIEIWTGRPWDKWTDDDRTLLFEGLPKE